MDREPDFETLHVIKTRASYNIFMAGDGCITMPSSSQLFTSASNTSMTMAKYIECLQIRSPLKAKKSTSLKPFQYVDDDGKL